MNGQDGLQVPFAGGNVLWGDVDCEVAPLLGGDGLLIDVGAKCPEFHFSIVKGSPLPQRIADLPSS